MRFAIRTAAALVAFTVLFSLTSVATTNDEVIAKELKSTQEEYINFSNFKVTLEGLKWQSFQNVEGLGVDIEDVPHQGEKNLILNRPGRFQPRNITLTRRFTKDREIYNWLKALKQGKQDRKAGSIILLDDEDNEVVRFNFFGAWVKAWGIEVAKDSQGGSILIEHFVLSVSDIEIGHDGKPDSKPSVTK